MLVYGCTVGISFLHPLTLTGVGVVINVAITQPAHLTRRTADTMHGCTAAQLKYHFPPRMSRKMTHHVRHAAAKLFKQLGLRGAARMDGWIDLRPG